MGQILLNNKIVNINSKFGFGTHAFIQGYQNRVLTNSGLDVSPIFSALDFLYRSIVNEGLFGNFLALYPMAGGNGGTGSLQTYAVNFISSSYTLSGAGITNAMCVANGYTGNGSTSYWDTGIIPSTHLTINNNGLAFYSRSQIVPSSGFLFDMGVRNNNSNQCFCLYSNANSGALPNVRFEANNATVTIVTNTSSLGYFSANRTSSSQIIAALNGSQFTVSNTNSGSMPTNSLLLGATYLVTAPSYHSSRQYAYFHVLSTGFTANQEAVMYKIIQAYQKMLNRAV